MQPKDLIEYVENEEEKKKYNFWNYFENISLQSDKSMILYNCQEGNQMTITRKGERRTDGADDERRNATFLKPWGWKGKYRVRSLESAIKEKNFEKAEELIAKMIDRTQKGIEDN